MQDFPETRQTLIDRIKDPDDAVAWTEFLGIYGPVVYGLARRRGLQDADAQDVTQQVFLSVSNAVERWVPGAGEPPFRAWLSTITRNAVTKELSRRKPDAASGSSSVDELLRALPADVDGVSDAEFATDSRLSALRFATEQIRPEFSDMTWRLFWESVVLGKSIADVARDAGRSTGSVYMARFKVLQRLKAKAMEVTEMWRLPPGEIR